MDALTAWTFAKIIELAPDSRALTPRFPEAAETLIERRLRLRSVAEDVVEVARERPLYSGKRAVERTVATILGVADLESDFDKDVDRGPCAPGRVAKKGCDSGRSACILQVNVGDGKTAEGWTKAELFADRKKCLRAGRERMRKSIGPCSKKGAGLALAAYASGSCGGGHAASRERVRHAERIFASMPR